MNHYYIIRSKLTNQWIPIAKQRNRTSANLTNEKPPRLFSTKGGAKNALNWWLGGEMVSDMDGDIVYKKFVATRKHLKEEMEIIKIELREIKNEC